MNQNQLKYFVAAAETRSFTKAAEQFYISQTAITQQIQPAGADALGCVLFDRSTRPVTPDAGAGKSFLLEAKAILERMSQARRSACMTRRRASPAALRVGYRAGL